MLGQRSVAPNRPRRRDFQAFGMPSHKSFAGGALPMPQKLPPLPWHTYPVTGYRILPSDTGWFLDSPVHETPAWGKRLHKSDKKLTGPRLPSVITTYIFYS